VEQEEAHKYRSQRAHQSLEGVPGEVYLRGKALRGEFGQIEKSRKEECGQGADLAEASRGRWCPLEVRD